ncbi:hypothetical protein ACOMHN_056261 [Nucella lapillus]
MDRGSWAAHNSHCDQWTHPLVTSERKMSCIAKTTEDGNQRGMKIDEAVSGIRNGELGRKKDRREEGGEIKLRRRGSGQGGSENDTFL